MPLEAPFRVGEWQVRPLQCEITGPGGKTKLQPRVMQVLACLAEQPGKVVGREEILEQVWGDRYVSDEVLTVAIQKLRRVLGDDAKNPRFVQTVPGKGYRLNEVAHESPRLGAAEPDAQVSKTRSWQSFLWMAAALVGAVVLVLFARGFGPRPDERPPTRIAIDPPPESVAETFVISPDGKRLAFIAPNTDGVDTIWVRELDSGSTRALAGTENVWRLFWSPDSDQIGFSTVGQLKIVSLSQERSETIINKSFWGGGAWSHEGMVLSDDFGELYRMQVAGTELTPLTVEDGVSPNADRTFPSFLPDGTRFLYFVSQAFERGKIFVGSLETDETAFVLESDSKAVYADGYLLFVREGALHAQAFDTDLLRLQGEPQVLEALMMSPQVYRGVDSSLSVSRNGIVAFRGGTAPAGQLVWFDREGKERGRIPQPPSGEYVNPSVSPDGRTIAANLRDPATGNVDIWLIDVETSRASRFTTSASPETDLVWSPDGEQVVFGAYREGRHNVWIKPSAGGDEELLWQVPHREIRFGVIPRDWSPDGSLVLCAATFSAPFDLWAVPLSGEQEPWQVLDTPASEISAQLSPNGEWIAYSSDETSAYEVYVMRFSDRTGKQIVSVGGGTHPRWRQDGKELYFWGGSNRIGTVMRVDVSEDERGLQIGVPEPVVEAPLIGFFDARTNFAVTPDGQRFLLRRPSLSPPPATVIVNWTAELEDR